MDHPFSFVLYLMLAGISALFLGLVGAFFYSTYMHEQPAIPIPWPFIVSTLLIIATSYLFEKGKGIYQSSEFDKFRQLVQNIMWLTLAFTAFQVFGWYDLFTRKVGPEHSQSSAYLYVISGLHLLHIIFGLPFLFAFMRTLRKFAKDEGRSQIFFLDESNKYKFRHLGRYWHFLDILWIFLIVVFALQQLIKDGLHGLL